MHDYTMIGIRKHWRLNAGDTALQSALCTGHIYTVQEKFKNLKCCYCVFSLNSFPLSQMLWNVSAVTDDLPLTFKQIVYQALTGGFNGINFSSYAEITYLRF